jgi:YVTN family beta-propeller protein
VTYGETTEAARDDVEVRMPPPPVTPTATAIDTPPRPPVATAPAQLVETAASRLPAPRQDVAAAVLGRDVLLAGGLDAADASTAAIDRLRHGRPQSLGRLPVALHDAPAVALAGRMYVFGGGDGIAQHAEITGVDPATGATGREGTLPAASSDAAAAAVGPVAYVVGGYTGARWLDTIVAWRPGAPSRVVARLPHGLRYAAVAASGPRLVIAGGTLPDGSASSDVFVFDTRTHALRRVRSLPRSTTHAAAAALGPVVLVLGGRGTAPASVSRTIVAVDPVRGTTRRAGLLRTARSDLAAVTLGRRVLLVGGHGRAGTLAALSWVAPAAARTDPAGLVRNVYAADAAGRLTGAARQARPLVYVPNGGSNTVTVIDQRTRRVVGHYHVGGLPQHVTPSWDLRTLWVSDNSSNSLQAFDPRTGRPRGRPVPVTDPYNLYFTPDGRSAIVVEEAHQQLAFRDPHSWRLQHLLTLPCSGVDHMDFSADGSFLLVSCEFSGDLVRVDLRGLVVHRPLQLGAGLMPQDVKLAPDGSVFFVAEMMRGGVYVIDATARRILGFIRTGAGAHGLYPSRDARELYVTNRSAGTVSVLRFADRRIIATWRIPHGSPDMGGVSADGRTLWLSGRYNGEVYAIDTRTGRLRARIAVDDGPHGLAVWPQPGRYSLGHTGILR